MKHLIKKFFLKKNKDQSGATAVEFAIVILLFITIVFGIIEFGLLVYNQHIVTNAGREGARHGIVYRDTRITVGQIQNRVRNYADQYLVTFGGGLPNVTVPSGPCSGSGSLLSVNVEYNYNFLFLRFLQRQISATTTMRCE